MTKKDSRKEKSKHYVEEKESCGLSSLKDVEVFQKINEKKGNAYDNLVSVPSTYSTPRESIFEISDNLKDTKQHSNRPHSAPQIQNPKYQNYQATRLFRKSFDRQDIPRPRLEAPPFSPEEANAFRRCSNSKFRRKIQEITSYIFEATIRNRQSTNSQFSNHHYHHSNWSPRSSDSVSSTATMEHCGNIPKLSCEHHLYNDKSGEHECTNLQCQRERHKSRYKMKINIS